MSDPARSVDFHGTPPYMAPEYIRDNVLGPQADVYAAGLVLYELVCGRRAIGGDSLAQTLNAAVEGRIALPPDATVDQTLAGIIGKATAREPALRYPSAAAMREALARYLDPVDTQAAATGTSARASTLEFLLRRMRHRTDFPALSEAISSINRLTASESENIATLAATILRDFALTNKLLRVVNAAQFRATGAGNVSTVSRAIAILGFNAVRSIAISLLLFEHLPDKNQATALRDELLRANLTGRLSSIIRVNLQHTPVARLVAGSGQAPPQPAAGEGGVAPELTTTLLEPAAGTPSAAAPGRHDALREAPADAPALLAAGIQDISHALVEDFALNDVLRIILETIYRALGFRHVLLAVRDPKAGAFAGRLGFGPDSEAITRRFRFPLGGFADVFNIALAKSVDLLIHDAGEPAIRPRIPAWYREAIGAPTFLLLPMAIRGAPVALIYADKAVANAIVIAERELALLRTLRNQAVLALKQSS